VSKVRGGPNSALLLNRAMETGLACACASTPLGVRASAEATLDPLVIRSSLSASAETARSSARIKRWRGMLVTDSQMKTKCVCQIYEKRGSRWNEGCKFESTPYPQQNPVNIAPKRRVPAP